MEQHKNCNFQFPERKAVSVNDVSYTVEEHDI